MSNNKSNDLIPDDFQDLQKKLRRKRRSFILDKNERRKLIDKDAENMDSLGSLLQNLNKSWKLESYPAGFGRLALIRHKIFQLLRLFLAPLLYFLAVIVEIINELSKRLGDLTSDSSIRYEEQNQKIQELEKEIQKLKKHLADIENTQSKKSNSPDL